MDVIATDVGFFNSQIKEVGDKFTLDDESQFCEAWMKKAGKSAEPKVSEPVKVPARK